MLIHPLVSVWSRWQTNKHNLLGRFNKKDQNSVSIWYKSCDQRDVTSCWTVVLIQCIHWIIHVEEEVEPVNVLLVVHPCESSVYGRLLAPIEPLNATAQSFSFGSFQTQVQHQHLVHWIRSVWLAGSEGCGDPTGWVRSGKKHLKLYGGSGWVWSSGLLGKKGKTSGLGWVRTQQTEYLSGSEPKRQVSSLSQD